MIVKMTSLQEKKRSWIPLLFAIILFIGIGTIILPKKTTPFPPYLTESPSPTGTKAFYSFLEEHNNQVSIWKKPSESLPSLSTPQLMLMIEPSYPFNPMETEDWIQWLEEGNRIWLITDNPTDYFPLETTFYVEEESIKVGTITGMNTMSGSYQGRIETATRLLPDLGDQVLLEDYSGVIALSRKYGKGELMVLLTPNWLTNGAILEHDHVKMILPFIQQNEHGVIWFNEFIHGSTNQPPIVEIYPEWFLLLLAQGIVILLLWLWYKGKRFGSIETPREWIVRFGDERIRAIASWNERGGFYKESLLTQEEYLRHRMQEKWGIPSNLENAKLLDTLRNRLSQEKLKQWRIYWNDFQRVRIATKITPKAYVQWSKRFEEMQKEV